MSLEPERQPASDAELVQATLTEPGSHGFEELVKRYQGLVMGIVGATVVDSHDRNDVAQEVFVKAFRSLDQLREKGKFGSWIGMIAANESRRHVTGRHSVARRLSLPLHGEDGRAIELSDESQGSPADQVLQQDQQRLILQCVADLPEIYGTTVYLRYVRGHSCREVAAIEGVPVGVITCRLSRAYDILRLKLDRVLGKGVES